MLMFFDVCRIIYFTKPQQTQDKLRSRGGSKEGYDRGNQNGFFLINLKNLTYCKTHYNAKGR